MTEVGPQLHDTDKTRSLSLVNQKISIAVSIQDQTLIIEVTVVKYFDFDRRALLKFVSGTKLAGTVNDAKHLHSRPRVTNLYCILKK